jgi:hypothetical protein
MKEITIKIEDKLADFVDREGLEFDRFDRPGEMEPHLDPLDSMGGITRRRDPLRHKCLVLRPKPWAPKEEEKCLFLNFGRPGGLVEERWDGDNPWHRQALAAGACWPISRRAEAEACVERVKKAIGGGE